jgi:hypothetical protein
MVHRSATIDVGTNRGTAFNRRAEEPAVPVTHQIAAVTAAAVTGGELIDSLELNSGWRRFRLRMNAIARYGDGERESRSPIPW